MDVVWVGGSLVRVSFLVGGKRERLIASFRSDAEQNNAKADPGVLITPPPLGHRPLFTGHIAAGRLLGPSISDERR